MGFYALFRVTFVGFPGSLMGFQEGWRGVANPFPLAGGEIPLGLSWNWIFQGPECGRHRAWAGRGSELGKPRPVLPGKRRIGLSRGQTDEEGGLDKGQDNFMKPGGPRTMVC